MLPYLNPYMLVKNSKCIGRNVVSNKYFIILSKGLVQHMTTLRLNNPISPQSSQKHNGNSFFIFIKQLVCNKNLT